LQFVSNLHTSQTRVFANRIWYFGENTRKLDFDQTTMIIRKDDIFLQSHLFLASIVYQVSQKKCSVRSGFTSSKGTFVLGHPLLSRRINWIIKIVLKCSQFLSIWKINAIIDPWDIFLDLIINSKSFDRLRFLVWAPTYRFNKIFSQFLIIFGTWSSLKAELARKNILY